MRRQDRDGGCGGGAAGGSGEATDAPDDAGAWWLQGEGENSDEDPQAPDGKRRRLDGAGGGPAHASDRRQQHGASGRPPPADDGLPSCDELSRLIAEAAERADASRDRPAGPSRAAEPRGRHRAPSAAAAGSVAEDLRHVIAMGECEGAAALALRALVDSGATSSARLAETEALRDRKSVV